MIIFNKKMCFHNPTKSGIVVFDEINNYVITDYILNGHKCLVYNMRPETIYISPSVIYYFLKSLLIIDWEFIQKRKITALLKELLNHYRLGCLQFINPKVIITFIDNSRDYHWLCKKYKGPKFFTIQNGNRTNHDHFIRNSSRKFYLQNYFCFGNHEEYRNKEFKHYVDKFYPIGSLIAGYYKFSTRDIKIRKKYDICIISQYSKILYDKTLHKERLKWRAMDLMHTHLARYISENDVKVILLLREQVGNNSEIEYYNRFYNNQIDYIFNNKKEMSTYRYMDESEIVVSLFSTATLEAFGWGKKIVHFDFTGTNLYNDYKSIIVYRNKNYNHFNKHLNQLIAEPYSDYRKRTKEYASYLMNNNPDFPAHIYIRKKIEKCL